MISQVANIRDIELASSLNSSLGTLTSVQQKTSVSGMIGKFIQAQVDLGDNQVATVEGVVTGVRFQADGKPMLELDTGEVLTEAQVVMQYLAAQAPQARLAPSEGMARWRLLETLNFIATELHKGFGPFWKKVGEDAKEAARKLLLNRFGLLARKLGDKPYLLGDFSIADAYAFVMLTWARMHGVDLGDLPALKTYFERVRSRPAVRQALEEEGLPVA